MLFDLKKMLNSYLLSQIKHRFVLLMVSDVLLVAAEKIRIDNLIRIKLSLC